ncbi:MAG TPA: c-type cytochrome [Candidatus Sulfotelmatobacter sp.]
MNHLVKALLASLVCLCLFASVFLTGQESRSAKPGGASAVARGKYLVTGVGVCTDCHTPHDEAGNPEPGRELEGGPLWLLPAHTMANWPMQIPRIAGSISASDAELIKLLTTGIWKDGSHLRPPMPQFRMNQEDAAAVVAYLRSLNPKAPVQ